MSYRHSRSKSSSCNEENEDEDGGYRAFDRIQREVEEELENAERVLRQQPAGYSRVPTGRTMPTPQCRNTSYSDENGLPGQRPVSPNQQAFVRTGSTASDRNFSRGQPLGVCSYDTSRRTTSVGSDAPNEESLMYKSFDCSQQYAGRATGVPNERNLSRGPQTGPRSMVNPPRQMITTQSRIAVFPAEERPYSSAASRQLVNPSYIGRGFDEEQTNLENEQLPQDLYTSAVSTTHQPSRHSSPQNEDPYSTSLNTTYPSSRVTFPQNDGTYSVPPSASRQGSRAVSPQNDGTYSAPPSASRQGSRAVSPQNDEFYSLPPSASRQGSRAASPQNDMSYTTGVTDYSGSRAASPFNDRVSSSMRRSQSPEPINDENVYLPSSTRGSSPHYSQGVAFAEDSRSRSRASPESYYSEYRDSIAQQTEDSAYETSREPSALENLSATETQNMEGSRIASINQSLGSKGVPAISDEEEFALEETGLSATYSLGSRPGSHGRGETSVESAPRSSGICPQSCGKTIEKVSLPCHSQSLNQTQTVDCPSVSKSYYQSCGNCLEASLYPQFSAKNYAPTGSFFCSGKGESPPLGKPRHVPTLNEFFAQPPEPVVPQYTESNSENIRITQQHLCQLTTPRRGKPCVVKPDEGDIFARCCKAPVSQSRSLPKKPQLTKEELDALIRCETQDVTSAWYLTSDEKKTYKKPCPKQQKAQMTVKNIVHSHMHYPSSQTCPKEWTPLIEPDPEDISPDLAASMMFSQEQGYKLGDCPRETIKHLFPEDKGFQFRDKIPPSNVSIVTKKEDQDDMIEKSASVPSEGVSDSAYSRTMKKRGSEDSGSRISYDIDFALGQGKREYVLVTQKPRRSNKIQFRGNLPNWFPVSNNCSSNPDIYMSCSGSRSRRSEFILLYLNGFFSAFPDENLGVLKVVSSPSKLFEKAWQLTNPKTMPSSDVTVLE